MPADRPGHTGGRLGHVDAFRGLIMAHMALDHVSMFFNPGRWDGEFAARLPAPPVDLGQFLTRFSGVAVAPGFSFMAGFMVALTSGRRVARGVSEWTVTRRLVTRGLLLIGLEGLGCLAMRFVTVGVLMCLGTCLILLAFLRRLPTAVLLPLCLAILALHQPLELARWLPPWLAAILHDANPYDTVPEVGLLSMYPVLPWLGIMLAGFLAGRHRGALGDPTRAWLLLAGLFLVLFFAVRLPAGFGNAYPHHGPGSLDFWIFAKYPPDLPWITWSFAQIFLGLALLRALEDRRVTILLWPLRTYGRVPLFFYLVHFVVLGLVAHLRWIGPQPLGRTYLVWLGLLLALLPPCLAYGWLKLHRPNLVTRYV